jgi:hypothetical protein
MVVLSSLVCALAAASAFQKVEILPCNDDQFFRPASR